MLMNWNNLATQKLSQIENFKKKIALCHMMSRSFPKTKKLLILYTCEGSNFKLFSYTKKEEKPCK